MENVYSMMSEGRSEFASVLDVRPVLVMASDFPCVCRPTFLGWLEYIPPGRAGGRRVLQVEVPWCASPSCALGGTSLDSLRNRIFADLDKSVAASSTILTASGHCCSIFTSDSEMAAGPVSVSGVPVWRSTFVVAGCFVAVTHPVFLRKNSLGSNVIWLEIMFFFSVQVFCQTLSWTHPKYMAQHAPLGSFWFLIWAVLPPGWTNSPCFVGIPNLIPCLLS